MAILKMVENKTKVMENQIFKYRVVIKLLTNQNKVFFLNF